MLLINKREIDEMRLKRPIAAYSGKRISPIAMNDKRLWDEFGRNHEI